MHPLDGVVVCGGSLCPSPCPPCDCHLDSRKGLHVDPPPIQKCLKNSWNKTSTPITFIGAVKHVPGYQPDKWSKGLWWSCLNLRLNCVFIYFLKKLAKMSATVYFNTASHIWCCDRTWCAWKVLHQQPCLGHSNDSLQMVLHGFMCLSTFVISPLSCHTSVACAVDPSVTTSSTDFSFQNLVFWDLFEFSVVEII